MFVKNIVFFYDCKITTNKSYKWGHFGQIMLVFRFSSFDMLWG